MGAGRFVCVAVPYALTIASLVCILITMLSGITNKNLNMFEIDASKMSISSSDLQNLANSVKKDKRDLNLGAGALTNAALNGVSTGAVNFTAANFNLANSYKVYMWNYCYHSNSTYGDCTKGKFDWANDAINITYMNEKASAVSMGASGKNATLPRTVTDALKVYVKVSKWTQVVYLIALLFSVLTLITGLFGFCSRGGSCVTYIVSALATISIICASAMSTAASAIVVAAIQTTAKVYGVRAKMMTGFLSLTWIACAFSVGAGLFWMFSICCCKSESRGNKRNSEKFAPSAYQPINDPNTGYHPQTTGVYNPQAHKPANGAGYEPYSHSAV